MSLQGPPYDDAVGRAPLLQQLLRLIDCCCIRFSQEWGTAAAAAAAAPGAADAAEKPLGLPPVMEALVRCCRARPAAAAAAGTAAAAAGDREGDRVWAFRLLLLRVLLQRAQQLKPLAERGLIDFVAETVGDSRMAGAKRLHYWLR